MPVPVHAISGERNMIDGQGYGTLSVDLSGCTSFASKLTPAKLSFTCYWLSALRLSFIADSCEDSDSVRTILFFLSLIHI